MRGRAVARPSCVYTVNDSAAGGGGFDDVDDAVGNDVALQSFFVKNRNSGVDYGLELQFLTPYRVESIIKALIFGLDSTTNR